MQEQFGYAYDPAGNLNYRTNNALVQTFGVNNLNELTNVTRSGTLTVAGGTSATATSVTVADNGNSPVGATLYADKMFARTNVSLLNGNNTYTAIAQDSYNRKDTNSITLNLPATVSYIYDQNGNLTSDGTRGFDYDDENQLIRVTVTNSWKSELTYDGRMRRRIRKEFNWQNSAWAQTAEVRYIYDRLLVIQERDGNNLPTVTYTRGRDLSGSLQGAGGIGGLLARTDWANSQSACYHADGNGNITAMVNAQQIVVAKYIYDPFGNTLSKAGQLADANTYRFSSQEYHQNSGLVLYLYRAYDPNLQRWLNRDPIGELGGINLYAYVDNSPVNNSDLFGLDTCTCDRKMGGGPAKPRGLFWNTTPRYSHTFTFTTNPDGTIKHTYSWGNTANTKGWNKDQTEDIAAAKDALKNGYNWNEGGEDLDPFVEQAFNELNKKENEHVNLGVTRNCKTETEKLLDKAKADQKAFLDKAKADQKASN